MSHPVSCTIDLSAASGRQLGELRLPRGTDDDAFVWREEKRTVKITAGK